ncbi:MAG: hypothetical protein ACRDT4_18660 [Micromonosporaceae bacterium]
MPVLDEIKSKAETARNAIDGTRSVVLAAMQEAQDKANQVAALGLEGVAHTMMAARSSLESAASALGGAHEAAGNAVNTLGQITNPARISETVEHLGTAAGQFDQATSSVETAAASAHEAYNYAQQAEINSVTAVTGAVFDQLSTARQAIQDAKAASEAYRGQIEAVAAGN